MKRYLRDTVLVHKSRWSLVEPGFHWNYGEPNGRACLKHETGWRKVVGFMFATKTTVVWFQFRHKYRGF